MVHQYVSHGKLPVRYPIYIAVIAIAISTATTWATHDDKVNVRVQGMLGQGSVSQDEGQGMIRVFYSRWRWKRR